MNVKNTVVIFLIFFSLHGRENPFNPIILPEDSMRPYYGEARVFNEQEINLPSTARLIKKIDITYQNIDGSVATKSVDVSGRIDWNMPIKISQTLKPKDERILKDNIKVNGNRLEIKYRGRVIRDFMMRNPDRLVIDLEKNNKYHNHKTINIDTTYFKSVRFGLHDNFIRVVVQLTGSYIYTIENMQNGIAINVE